MASLTLEKGNPHIRVLDSLNKVLNSPKGLDGVASLLPVTLPPLRALDKIELAWGSSSLEAVGEVFALVRAFEVYFLRYNLVSTDPAIKSRKVAFEIKLQHRRDEPWWWIKRTDKRDREAEDDIDARLKKLWSTFGVDWKGMRVSAVARPSGVEDCLAKLDEVIRAIASGEKAPQVAPAPKTAPAQPVPQPQRQMAVPQVQHHPQRAPQAPMGQNQAQRSMPTPNQNQSQSMYQAQHNALKRKPSSQGMNPRASKQHFIEID